MKKAGKIVCMGAAITLITTMIRWNYIVELLGYSVEAASQLVAGEAINGMFLQEINTLSISKFVNISFLDEYTGETVDFENILDADEE